MNFEENFPVCRFAVMNEIIDLSWQVFVLFYYSVI